jgi:hypothetical protein
MRTADRSGRNALRVGALALTATMCLMLAGCAAASSNASDKSEQVQHNGFYGGVSGGIGDTMRP